MLYVSSSELGVYFDRLVDIFCPNIPIFAFVSCILCLCLNACRKRKRPNGQVRWLQYYRELGLSFNSSLHMFDSFHDSESRMSIVYRVRCQYKSNYVYLCLIRIIQAKQAVR
jgi:hypothetical protein